MAHDVFISYGREDAALMQQVETALRDAGLTIWTDKGIAPGSPSWKAAIEQAILDAGCIVVLFSPDSVESRWVRAELDYADAQTKPIYPLLVRGDAANAVPFGFTTYQWIDVRDPSRLQSGLAQLIAAIKGTTPIAAHHASLPAAVPLSHKWFRRWLPLLAVVAILGLVGTLLYSSGTPPTIAPATATIQTAETDRPAGSSALPTMPPFELPANFQKIEGQQTIFAVPASWTVNMDPSLITDIMSGDAPSDAKNELIQTIIDGVDGNGIDLLNVLGTVIAVENIGFPITYDLLQDRQQKMFETFDPEGIFTSAVFVDMPAGRMLYAQGEISDNTTLMYDYVLLRGTIVYHIFISGRVADRAKIETIGQQIARSFRVKT